LSFWRVVPDGVIVMVKVHPRAKRPGVHGVQVLGFGPRLKIAVVEPAEDGKANAAVCDLLADVLHRPRSSVRIVAGAAHREKLLSVSADAAALIAKLASL